jgi:hypothetical protein
MLFVFERGYNLHPQRAALEHCRCSAGIAEKQFPEGIPENPEMMAAF